MILTEIVRDGRMPQKKGPGRRRRQEIRKNRSPEEQELRNPEKQNSGSGKTEFRVRKNRIQGQEKQNSGIRKKLSRIPDM